jgi:hypothetical protein
LFESKITELPDLKISFLPGDLHLREENGLFTVSLHGAEILRTQYKSAAVNRFNAIRREMENQFPNRDATPEEKLSLLNRMLNDFAVTETLRRPPKKRSTARSTRTFG